MKAILKFFIFCGSAIILYALVTTIKDSLGIGKKPYDYKADLGIPTYKEDEKYKAFGDMVSKSNCFIGDKDVPRRNNSAFNLHVYYPCGWEFFEDTTDSSKKLIHSLSDTSTVAITVEYEPNPIPLTDIKIAYASSAEYLKNWTEQNDRLFISSVSNTIDKIKCAEVISRKQTAVAPFTFLMSYIFFTKNEIITITYFAGSNTWKQASYIFEEYKNVFRKWAERTTFYH